MTKKDQLAVSPAFEKLRESREQERPAGPSPRRIAIAWMLGEPLPGEAEAPQEDNA